MTRYAGIILAAGLSTRMGRFKPLLPLGETSVLATCITSFTKNGVQPYVVTGNRGDETTRVAKASGATCVHNPAYENGMFSSVVAGVAALPKDIHAFCLLPVDIPLVRPQTIGHLLNEFEAQKSLILYPKFKNERGHPPIIHHSLLPEILAHDGSGGLRTVLEKHESDARDLDVADWGIVHDLDTPDDYEQALNYYGKGYPTTEECEQLWEMYNLPEHTRAHCRAVARICESFCRHLKMVDQSHPLDLQFCLSAALIHDIAKGEKHHDAVGAELLRKHGFPAAAEIVATHSDMEPRIDFPINEHELVFIADKFVHGTTFVPLQKRYMDKISLFGDKPEVREKILTRLTRAQTICARIDTALGTSAEKLAQEALA